MKRPDLLKPKVFLSYARDDAETAHALFEELQRHDLSSFVDTVEIRTGERFPERLTKAIRESDAFIALLSHRYAESSWCQAELHHAHAFRKLILPIVLDDSTPQDLPDPARSVLTELNWMVATSLPAISDVAVKTATDYRSLSWAPIIRLARRSLMIAAVAAISLVAFLIGISRLNAADAEKRVEGVVSEIKTASHIFDREQIDAFIKTVPDPQMLASRCVSMSSTPSLTDVERFNAMLIANRILAASFVRSRWIFNDIDWNVGILAESEIADLSFVDGSITDVELVDCTLSGILWASSDPESQSLLQISELKADRSYFYGNTFEDCYCGMCEFKNCRLIGSVLDVTDWVEVRILAKTSFDNPSIITDEIALVERCVIRNDREPPIKKPGVLDMTDQLVEVRFDDVIFIDTRFEGYVRPEWFSDCSFENCIFPDKEIETRIRETGNLFVD